MPYSPDEVRALFARAEAEAPSPGVTVSGSALEYDRARSGKLWPEYDSPHTY